MTKLQQFLSAFLIIGLFLLTYSTLTRPIITPDTVLNDFMLSARRVFIEMNRFHQAAAQKQTQKTLHIVRKGISLFPDRLDLRLGEIHFCQIIGDVNCMTQGIAETLAQAQINDHHWQWGADEQRGKRFMLSRFQAFQKNLWQAQEDAAFQKNAELILSYYPDNVMNLDNLGVYYLEKKEYQKAKDFLERAHLLSPTDKEVSAHLKQLKNKQPKEVQKKKR